MPRIIDQFGRKRCQKKRKDVKYKLLYQTAVKNSFSIYLWSKVDSCFCGALYNLQYRKCQNMTLKYPMIEGGVAFEGLMQSGFLGGGDLNKIENESYKAISPK